MKRTIEKGPGVVPQLHAFYTTLYTMGKSENPGKSAYQKAERRILSPVRLPFRHSAFCWVLGGLAVGFLNRLPQLLPLFTTFSVDLSCHRGAIV